MKFHMNGVYLGQIFKKETGQTFLKYLTNVRISEAKRLLREENSTVAETARWSATAQASISARSLCGT